MNYPTLAIISFDADADAAEREQAEDRSLNVLLRQRRVRSEIFRLGLEPKAPDVELLSEILAMTPQRPLVMIVRQADEFSAQRNALRQFAALSQNVIVVHIGTRAADLAELAALGKQLVLENDGAAEMLRLAETLARGL